MRLFSLTFLAVAFCAIQAWSYWTNASIATVNRWLNESVTPSCTLSVDVRPQGALASLDVYFNVQSYQITAQDSIEIRSDWRLPSEALVDSMILWINGEPVPAMHISMSQANATYNSIVKVRRDPAILTKYGSNYYGNDNAYNLKVFPAFKNQTRHVRIYMHLQGGLASSLKNIDLGCPGKTVVLVSLSLEMKTLPVLNAGYLRQVKVDGKNLLRADSLSPVGTVLNLDPEFSPVLPEGFFGVIDTTRSDTSYLGLYIDFPKALGRYTSGKRLTFMWVPSSSDYSGNSRVSDEKRALAEYIGNMALSDAFNIVCAGKKTKMLEPRMIPATDKARAKAAAFLDSLALPTSKITAAETFEALKSAFGSIASTDTPAVVFCMDLEPMAYSSYYSSQPDYSAMVNALVAINVNKATFYAYVNSTKNTFYQQLAQALGGKICWWPQYNNLSSVVDEAFLPVVTNADIQFTPDIVSDGITYCPYYTSTTQFSSYGTSASTSQPRCNKEMSCYGKITAKSVSVKVSAKVDGVPVSREFKIKDLGSAASGLAMDKRWAIRMIDKFWTSGQSGWIINPTRRIGELAGLDRNDDRVYSTLVDLSLKKGVLTCATALLALEPGMKLVDDPMMPDDGNSGTVITTAVEGDSLKNIEKKETLTASPNPFNPSTKITLTSAQLRGVVTLNVYGIDGRLVRAITANAGAGVAVFEWNGRDLSGKKLASGLYIGRAVVGKKVMEIKLLLAK